MKQVAVLGASGMLGRMVTRVLAEDPQIEVVGTVRSNELKSRLEQADAGRSVRYEMLDIGSDHQSALAALLPGMDCVVNAIGITKPYIHDDSASEVQNALQVNCLFPHDIVRAYQGPVLQIATDCVYSGRAGQYTESSKHDAEDVYGKSKSIGEVPYDSFHHLRCSIIGPELKTQAFLLEWLRKQPRGTELNGFVNHLWNGVTTYHFGRLCAGYVHGNLELPNLLHVVPANHVTKYSLLGEFAARFGRDDLVLRKTNAAQRVDRSLNTEHHERNDALWAAAGYAQAPTIEQMVTEMADWMKDHWE